MSATDMYGRRCRGGAEILVAHGRNTQQSWCPGRRGAATDETMSTAGESKSVFSGSISDLKTKKAPPHPILQFCYYQEPHWMMVFTLSHLLFWLRGIPHKPEAFRFYNDNKFNHDGGIPSGPFGSGIFPVSLILTVVVTVTVLAKVAVFKPEV